MRRAAPCEFRVLVFVPDLAASLAGHVCHPSGAAIDSKCIIRNKRNIRKPQLRYARALDALGRRLRIRLRRLYALCFVATRKNVLVVASGLARVRISVQLHGLRSQVRRFESFWGHTRLWATRCCRTGSSC